MSQVAAMLAPNSTTATALHGRPRHTPTAATSAHATCNTKPISNKGPGSPTSIAGT